MFEYQKKKKKSYTNISDNLINFNTYKSTRFVISNRIFVEILYFLYNYISYNCGEKKLYKKYIKTLIVVN